MEASASTVAQRRSPIKATLAPRRWHVIANGARVALAALLLTIATPSVASADQLLAMSGENFVMTVPGWLGTTCSTAVTSPGYPPTTTGTTAGFTSCGAGTQSSAVPEMTGLTTIRSNAPSSFGSYTVGIVVAQWSTLALPDDARIIRATARLGVGEVVNSDSRDLVGEWYTWQEGAGDLNYSAVPVDNALSPIPLSTIATGPREFDLRDPDEFINRAGTSGVRFHIGGGQPSGRNRVGFLGERDIANASPDTHDPAALVIEYISAIRPCDVAPIDAGVSHTVAARADGTPLSWGGNEFGQLSTGTTQGRVMADRATPVNVVSIAAGANHTVLLLHDGTVWAAGKNESGQLGAGAGGADSSVPVRVTGLEGVVAVAAGTRHSLALKSDGTAWAWGSNAAGQLGTGSTTSSATPVQVAGLTGAASIAAGEFHSLAVISGGALRAWGLNEHGQLGDGTTTTRLVPGAPVLAGVRSVAGGAEHTVAVMTDGTARAWGGNTSGEVGDGTLTTRTVPQIVAGVTGAVQAAAGAAHNLVLLRNGHVLAWGANSSGQLGLGTTGAPVRSATEVAGIVSGRFVAAGAHHSLVVDPAGAVFAWGPNDAGQLGDGTAERRVSPVAVTDVDGLGRPCTWTG